MIPCKGQFKKKNIQIFTDKMARSFHTSWNNSGEPRDSGRHFRLVPAEAGYVSVLLLLAPDRGQNPSSQFVGKNAAFGGYAHLLSQERLLKLADLIQSQTLTYVKAPFCSTLESLCKIVSLSFHKKTAPERWTEALPGSFSWRAGRNLQGTKVIQLVILYLIL